MNTPHLGELLFALAFLLAFLYGFQFMRDWIDRRYPPARRSSIARPKGKSTMMTLEDLLFTLEVCKKQLPFDAHPVHYQRLDTIERIVRRAYESIRTDRMEQESFKREDTRK